MMVLQWSLIRKHAGITSGVSIRAFPTKPGDPDGINPRFVRYVSVLGTTTTRHTRTVIREQYSTRTVRSGRYEQTIWVRYSQGTRRCPQSSREEAAAPKASSDAAFVVPCRGDEAEAAAAAPGEKQLVAESRKTQA